MIREVVAGLLVASAPTVAFTVRDPRIDEASGIAPGLRSPGVVYVQNDSGDQARFFAVDARTGATAATVLVPGATNVDWEDIAVAADTRGRPSVWLADTGDNDATRREVRLYRVDEPRVDPGAGDRTLRTARPDVWRLRYPGGPADVESLAVAPGGAAYLVTKSFGGGSVVYRVPPAPDAGRVQVVTRVAAITFALTGTPGGPNAIGQLTATGAAFNRDGTVFAVRTYTDAYFWPVRAGDLASALRTRPVRVALPAQPQGEGIAFSAGTVLIDSEGLDQPVYGIALPALPRPPVAPTTPPATNPTSAADALGAGPTELIFTRPDQDSDTTRYLAGGAVIVVLAVVVGMVVLRRRRRH